MKRYVILSIILILFIFTGCGKESEENIEEIHKEYEGDDFNNGYCPDDHGEYVLTGVSRKFYHYTCDKCGKEIKTKNIN